MPKGLTCPDQVNPTFEWSWSEPNNDKFSTLPDWLKDKMKRSKEYAAWIASAKVEQVNSVESDESPF